MQKYLSLTHTSKAVIDNPKRVSSSFVPFTCTKKSASLIYIPEETEVQQSKLQLKFTQPSLITSMAKELKKYNMLYVCVITKSANHTLRTSTKRQISYTSK